MQRKFYLATVLIALLLSTQSAFVQTTSIDQLRAQIQFLLNQIQQLRAKQSNGAPKSSCPTAYLFNRSFGFGEKSADVAALQKLLQKEGLSISENEAQTGTFKESTRLAVVQFQEKYRDELLTPNHLERGTGYVGSITRTKLNTLQGCGKQVDATPYYGSLALLTPNEGEVLFELYSYTIRWRGPVNNIKYRLTVQDEKGATAGTIVDNFTPVFDQYAWDIGKVTNQEGVQTLLAPGRYKITVTNLTSQESDASDVFFSIVSTQSSNKPLTRIITPNGGETYAIGQTIQVRWSSQNLPPNAYMSIGLSRKLPSDGRFGAAALSKGDGSTLNSGLLSWTIPAISTIDPGNDYVIAVSGCVKDPSSSEGTRCSPYDESDAPFTIMASNGTMNTTPAVDLKINNSDGPLTVALGDIIPMSWAAVGVQSCRFTNIGWSAFSEPTTGSVLLSGCTADSIASQTCGRQSEVFTIQCYNTVGNVVAQDSVSLNIQGR